MSTSRRNLSDLNAADPFITVDGNGSLATAFGDNDVCAFYEPCPRSRYIFIITGSAIALLGVIMNVICLSIFTKPKNRNSPYLYLAVLSFLDVWICLIYVLLFGVDVMAQYIHVRFLYELWYVYVLPLFLVAKIVQLMVPYVILATTFERYVLTAKMNGVEIGGGGGKSSCLQLLVGNRGRRTVIASVFLVCVTFKLPTIAEFRINHYPECRDFLGGKEVWPTEFYHNPLWKNWEFYVIQLLQFFLSFLLLSLLNALIIQNIIQRRRTERRAKGQSIINPLLFNKRRSGRKSTARFHHGAGRRSLALFQRKLSRKETTTTSSGATVAQQWKNGRISSASVTAVPVNGGKGPGNDEGLDDYSSTGLQKRQDDRRFRRQQSDTKSLLINGNCGRRKVDAENHGLLTEQQKNVQKDGWKMNKKMAGNERQDGSIIDSNDNVGEHCLSSRKKSYQRLMNDYDHDEAMMTDPNDDLKQIPLYHMTRTDLPAAQKNYNQEPTMIEKNNFHRDGRREVEKQQQDFDHLSSTHCQHLLKRTDSTARHCSNQKTRKSIHVTAAAGIMGRSSTSDSSSTRGQNHRQTQSQQKVGTFLMADFSFNAIRLTSYEMKRRTSFAREISDAAKTTIALVSSHLICNSLQVFVKILEINESWLIRDPTTGSSTRFYTYISDIISFLVMLACSVRLPIYLLCNHDIRRQFRRLFPTPRKI